MKRAWGWLLAVVLIALDQWTKWLAVRSLTFGQRQVVDSRFLDLTLVHNKGAAFGIGNNWPDGARLVVFYGMRSLAIGVILYILYKLDWRKEKCSVWGLLFVLAGAIGNVIDCLRWGYVVDFISMHWSRYYWPAYNVADAAICVGASLLLIGALAKKGEAA